MFSPPHVFYFFLIVGCGSPWESDPCEIPIPYNSKGQKVFQMSQKVNLDREVNMVKGNAIFWETQPLWCSDDFREVESKIMDKIGARLADACRAQNHAIREEGGQTCDDSSYSPCLLWQQKMSAPSQSLTTKVEVGMSLDTGSLYAKIEGEWSWNSGDGQTFIGICLPPQALDAYQEVQTTLQIMRLKRQQICADG